MKEIKCKDCGAVVRREEPIIYLSPLERILEKLEKDCRPYWYNIASPSERLKASLEKLKSHIKEIISFYEWEKPLTGLCSPRIKCIICKARESSIRRKKGASVDEELSSSDEGFGDEDRTYLPSEQALDQRLDCCSKRMCSAT